MKFSMRWIILLAILTAASLAPAVLADVPNGNGPGDPLMVPANWTTIQPNASLWFYFDYTGNRSQIEVDLDADGASGLQVAIFTPAQASAWVQDRTVKPVALGSRQHPRSAAAIHDLVWVGAFNFPGRFFAVVSNKSSGPLAFRLLIRGTDVALAPTPVPARRPTRPNPYATVIPTGTLAGRLLFQDASGGIIYTVNGDGTNLTPVSQGIDPNWSPNGQKITFTRWSEPAGVYTANADGSGERIIFGGENILSPQWSPDGAQIAFTRFLSGPEFGRVCFFVVYCFRVPNKPPWRLGVVDVSTGKLSEPRSSRSAFSPTWRGDNHTLAFADAQFGILGTDTIGGSEYNLFTENPAVQSTRYSPDGNRIAFQVKQHDHWEINVVNADGSNVRALTFADPLATERVNNVAPTWSPDGGQILFLSDRGGKWEFFVVDLDGGNLKQVLKNVTDAVQIHYNFTNERVIDWLR